MVDKSKIKFQIQKYIFELGGNIQEEFKPQRFIQNILSVFGNRIYI